MSADTNDVRERLQEIARTVSVMLPPYTGFIILAFDLDTNKGGLEYISNGEREGCIKAMKEFIAKSEKTWGKHLTPMSETEKREKAAEWDKLRKEMHRELNPRVCLSYENSIARIEAEFEKQDERPEDWL